MSNAADASRGSSDWSKRSFEELDNIPKGGWIAIMVVSFVLFWPAGLAVLGYLIWSGKMQSWKHNRKSCGHRHRYGRRRSTGNSAFDAYRAETLERLERERAEFEEYLDNLRRAKDQKEFDDFMTQRKAQGSEGPSASV